MTIQGKFVWPAGFLLFAAGTVLALHLSTIIGQ